MSIIIKLRSALNKGEVPSVIDGIAPAISHHDIGNLDIFIAQCAHETAGFTRLVENLNYSADGLAKTWPKRFSESGKPNALAIELHRKPADIANHVYANRMGNGDIDSGDGWLYRGRGLLQITGRYNYSQCAKDTCMNCENNPDILVDPYYAVESAVWFWEKKGLDRVNDVVYSTKIINGGANGLSDRMNRLERIRSIK